MIWPEALIDRNIKCMELPISTIFNNFHTLIGLLVFSSIKWFERFILKMKYFLSWKHGHWTNRARGQNWRKIPQYRQILPIPVHHLQWNAFFRYNSPINLHCVRSFGWAPGKTWAMQYAAFFWPKLCTNPYLLFNYLFFSPPIPLFGPNLPGPQITWKWALHTDKLSIKCHLWAYLKAGWLNVQDLGPAIHNSEGSHW